MAKRSDPVTWYRLPAEAALSRLKTSLEHGLDPSEVAARLARQGPNVIAEGPRRSLLSMLGGQFADFMILVLLAAAVISGVIGEAQDTVAILVIVVLNALIGAVQEYRAERAMAALRRMAAPAARVRREGALVTCPAQELVPGDLVLLDAGALAPADLRMVEVVNLQTDESALTGESHPVEKTTAPIDAADVPLGDQRNLVFKGTSVTRGRGTGVVVATGMDTEIGRIAKLLSGAAGVRTPLQQRLARFGSHLALAVLAICGVVFVSGLLQGQPPVLMFLTAVSLAVAAIPEALPAVITVSLAFGARKLSRRHALVRRLPAVETLGSVTFICSDKTGTLTENRMTAEVFVAAGEQRAALPGPGAGAAWSALGRALALCNDVELQRQRLAGDPTEVALYRAAAQSGFEKPAVEKQLPRVAEIPFDSERKLMTTLHRDENRFLALVKGAPEVLLTRCSRVLGMPGGDPWAPHRLLAQVQALAAEGYRVLALAERRVATLPDPLLGVEYDLTLLGLVGLIDPPRPEVAQAVADCRSAGITPVMISGDHPSTARCVAVRLGIAEEGADVLTGQQLAKLADHEFARRVGEVRVYARVSPEQKIRVVDTLQEQGQFVAMTGDGVNDAPALRRAGIGVAMGRKGTDVAREAADMVLLDDNFATIVGAVREGRRIFDNIRKFIKYTMTSNSGEIWTLFLAPFLGLPVPLLPIHILWINLVTDGLPGLAMTAEPAEQGVMQRPPRPPSESIFARGMWQHILWVGLLIGGLSIASQAWAYGRGAEYWQTVVFTVLTISQLFHALAVRGERASLFRLGLTSNLPILGAVLLTVVLQIAVIYVPALNPIFKTQPLPWVDLAACFALSSLVLVAVEIEKVLVRRGWLYRNPSAS